MSRSSRQSACSRARDSSTAAHSASPASTSPAARTTSTKAGSSAFSPLRDRGHTAPARRSMTQWIPSSVIFGSRGNSRQDRGRSARAQVPGQTASFPRAPCFTCQPGRS